MAKRSPPIPENASSRLNLIMEATGTDPSVIYNALGWTSSRFSGYRNGSRQISADAGMKICQHLPCNILWLLGGSPNGILKADVKEEVMRLLAGGWVDEMKGPRRGLRGRPKSAKAK